MVLFSTEILPFRTASANHCCTLMAASLKRMINDNDNDKNCDDSIEYCDEQLPTVFALFDTDLKHKCSSFALFPEKDQDEDHF